MGQDEARSITKITAEHEASEDPASTVSEKSIACAANSVPIPKGGSSGSRDSFLFLPQLSVEGMLLRRKTLFLLCSWRLAICSSFLLLLYPVEKGFEGMRIAEVKLHLGPERKEGWNLDWNWNSMLLVDFVTAPGIPEGQKILFWPRTPEQLLFVHRHH